MGDHQAPLYLPLLYTRANSLKDNIFKIMDLLKKVDNLFEKIKHGDKKHQEWLDNAIKEHFKGYINI